MLSNERKQMEKTTLSINLSGNGPKKWFLREGLNILIIRVYFETGGWREESKQACVTVKNKIK